MKRFNKLHKEQAIADLRHAFGDSFMATFEISFAFGLVRIIISEPDGVRRSTEFVIYKSSQLVTAVRAFIAGYTAVDLPWK